MRVSEAQIRLYQDEMERVKAEFANYADDYLARGKDLGLFKYQMQQGLKSYYIRIALIAKGQKKFTKLDKKDLQRFLGMIYGYLDGFIADLGNYKALASDQGVVSRASSYGYGWGVFSRYTIPGELADMLPDLPGVSCMGGEACGCWLEYDADEEGYHVYWYVTPLKNHCPVCADLTIEWSPLTISREELVEEWGDEILDENGEIIEF
jgi:hypothetical protein